MNPWRQSPPSMESVTSLPIRNWACLDSFRQYILISICDGVYLVRVDAVFLLFQAGAGLFAAGDDGQIGGYINNHPIGWLRMYGYWTLYTGKLSAIIEKN